MNSADIAAEPAALLALAEVLSPHLNGAASWRLAEAIEIAQLGYSGGDVGLLCPDDVEWLRGAAGQVRDDRLEVWRRELDRLESQGVSLVTAADDRYPANLRMIQNRPPFLFVRGTFEHGDDRAIAVVGTRHPGTAGVTAAHQIAAELARRQVTVVSGLAEGIDTAAHTGALSAGGRTIAVFGTGIDVTFPAKNRQLASDISASGACVSQFWPSVRGARWTFPVRNVVTSGLSLGTVVVEAGETSGARLQAHEAIRHGKRLFLLRDLVTTQPWARAVAERADTAVVDSVDDLVRAIDVDLATEPLALL